MLCNSASIAGTDCFGRADGHGAQLFSATEQGISIERGCVGRGHCFFDCGGGEEVAGWVKSNVR